MKKLFCLLFSVLLLSGCGQQSAVTADANSYEVETPEIIRLGYCPTMAPEALNLQNQNPELVMMEFGSAEMTLNELKAENIDLALVGRKADPDEIVPETYEKKIGAEIYTLIAPRKKIVSVNDLRDFTVNTCAPTEIEQAYPELSLTFKDCDYEDGNIWLAPWEECTDGFQLMVPINEQGKKVRKYRSAFLYALTEPSNLIF